MKLISIGDDSDAPLVAHKRPFIHFGPHRTIHPDELDTWKIFFSMGLATGILLYGVKARSKGGGGYIP